MMTDWSDLRYKQDMRITRVCARMLPSLMLLLGGGVAAAQQQAWGSQEHPENATPASAAEGERPAETGSDVAQASSTQSPAGEVHGAEPLRTRARLMAGYSYRRRDVATVGGQPQPERSSQAFFLKQVRLGLKGRLAEELRFNVSFDLADRFKGAAGNATYLRTAYAEYRFGKPYRARLGRFKRPFSALELTGAADLPIARRGLLNSLIIEDAQWGDRAIGFMFHGKLKPAKLRYHLALTNPRWDAGVEAEGLDVIGRLRATPLSGLTLGVHGGYKHLRQGDSSEGHMALGGDATLKLGAFKLLLEGVYADLPWRDAQAFGGLALASYDLPLSEHWSVQPALFGEYADANAEYSQSESVRTVFGLNLIGYEDFRLMPQLELVRPVGDPLMEAAAAESNQINPWLSSERWMMLVSFQL